jgi:16S rRNA (guanine(966)-N(2))-methyltransferase RsmD
LFNVLSPEIEGVVFLDAYAGSGAVGIEALSRGASRAIFIEKSKPAAGVLRENLSSLGLLSRAEVLQGKTLQYLPHRPAEIVFLDPPYALENEYGQALSMVSAGDVRLAVAQHSSRFALAEEYGALRRTRTLRQGDNTLSFYRRDSGQGDGLDK